MFFIVKPTGVYQARIVDSGLRHFEVVKIIKGKEVGPPEKVTKLYSLEEACNSWWLRYAERSVVYWRGNLVAYMQLGYLESGRFEAHLLTEAGIDVILDESEVISSKQDLFTRLTNELFF
jgi:hypothetical protein